MRNFQNLQRNHATIPSMRSLDFVTIGFAVLAIVPVILLLNLLLQNTVNVPYADQWAVTNTVIKSATGTIGWQDLYAQHNESRKVFPRLIFIALAHLTHYNVNYEILVSFVMTCLISIVLFLLGVKTIYGMTRTHLFLLFITNLLLFTPAQYEAWMIGLSNVVFISIFCLTTSILVAFTQLSMRLKYAIGIGLALISTFSFANGLLLWVITLPVLIVANSTTSLVITIYRDRWLILVWLGAFCLTLFAYFYSYQKPAFHPSLTQALSEPGAVISYFFAFLGNPFAWGTKLDNPSFAVWIGAVLCGLFSLQIFYLLKNWQHQLLQKQAIGWVMLGVYAILSAAITTVGRVGFGVEQSLSPRYVTFAIYLPIAIVHLLPIIRHHASGRLVKFPAWLNQFVLSTLTIFLLLHGLTFWYSTEQMVIWRQERLQAKTCLGLINVMADVACLQRLEWGDPQWLRQTANTLNSLGWINPPLMPTNDIKYYSRQAQHGATGDGFVDQVTISKIQGKSVECSLAGWAILADQQKLPDAVLVSYDISTQQSLAFRAYAVNQKRPDVALLFKVPQYQFSGWTGKFDLDEIPEPAWSAQGKANITVWAFDLTHQRAVAIAQKQITRQI